MIPRPFSMASTCPLPLKQGNSDPIEAFVTEKWTILLTPALSAASNSVLVFLTTWSKDIRPCSYRIQ